MTLNIDNVILYDFDYIISEYVINNYDLQNYLNDFINKFDNNFTFEYYDNYLFYNFSYKNCDVNIQMIYSNEIYKHNTIHIKIYINNLITLIPFSELYNSFTELKEFILCEQ